MYRRIGLHARFTDIQQTSHIPHQHHQIHQSILSPQILKPDLDLSTYQHRGPVHPFSPIQYRQTSNGSRSVCSSFRSILKNIQIRPRLVSPAYVCLTSPCLALPYLALPYLALSTCTCFPKQKGELAVITSQLYFLWCSAWNSYWAACLLTVCDLKAEAYQEPTTLKVIIKRERTEW